MAGDKSYSTQKMSWKDFCIMVSALDLPPVHSYEIVDSTGRVVAKVLGEEELKKDAFSDITLSDVEKFFEKHADEFKEAQALIDKIKTAKKPMKHTKKELAEAKRRLKKYQEMTEKVWKRVYGNVKRDFHGYMHETARKLENDFEKQRRQRGPRKIFERDEDREDLKAARKAVKDKRPSVPFDELRKELRKKVAVPRKRLNKKGG